MEIITSHYNREYNLIEYFICDTSIGEMLFGRYRDAICFAAFTCNVGQAVALEELRSRFPKAELRQTADKFDPTLSQPHKILLIGTKFQISV